MEKQLAEGEGTAASPAQKAAPTAWMEYDHFLAERARIIEGRSRVQQRLDQLVTGGAAGALVLSISLLEKIAPHPLPDTRWLLMASWGGLLVALGPSLGSHVASGRAFEQLLHDFDASYTDGQPCPPAGKSSKVAAHLGGWSAISFVLGVAFLAGFAFQNTSFQETAHEQPDAPQAGTTQAPATTASAPAPATATTGTRRRDSVAAATTTTDKTLNH